MPKALPWCQCLSLLICRHFANSSSALQVWAGDRAGMCKWGCCPPAGPSCSSLLKGGGEDLPAGHCSSSAVGPDAPRSPPPSAGGGWPESCGTESTFCPLASVSPSCYNTDSVWTQCQGARQPHSLPKISCTQKQKEPRVGLSPSFHQVAMLWGHHLL